MTKQTHIDFFSLVVERAIVLDILARQGGIKGWLGGQGLSLTSATSHSSTESEVTSLEYTVRTEGMSALDFWGCCCTSLFFHPPLFAGGPLLRKKSKAQKSVTGRSAEFSTTLGGLFARTTKQQLRSSSKEDHQLCGTSVGLTG